MSHGECVIRYDNEAGKGDHVHLSGRECPYRFVSPDRLIGDFHDQIERWNFDRDVKAVHSDITALLAAGVLNRTDEGQVEFPYEAVKVEFLLQAA